MKFSEFNSENSHKIARKPAEYVKKKTIPLVYKLFYLIPNSSGNSGVAESFWATKPLTSAPFLCA